MDQHDGHLRRDWSQGRGGELGWYLTPATFHLQPREDISAMGFLYCHAQSPLWPWSLVSSSPSVLCHHSTAHPSRAFCRGHSANGQNHWLPVHTLSLSWLLLYGVACLMKSERHPPYWLSANCKTEFAKGPFCMGYRAHCNSTVKKKTLGVKG